MTASRRVWLALGSNLGDRLARLQEAVVGLRAGGVALDGASSIYETAPWGGIEQPDYLNAVVTGMTGLSSRDLLLLCKSIEAAAGRDFEAPRNSARPVDVDILLIEGELVRTPDLEVPHAAMHLRGFVLVPLASVAPDALHPRLGSSVAALLDALPEGERAAVRVVADPSWSGLESR